MGGGLLQLAAYGSENQYIHGNPQITFFKIVYKRHTNFAMETIEVPLDGPDQLAFNDTIRLKTKIPRNGDLIAHMYFKFKIPDSASNDVDKFYWTRQLGLSIIDYVNIYIGGQKIESLYGSYLDIVNQLTVPKAKQSVFNNMIGDSSFMSYLASYKSGYYPGFDFEKTEEQNYQEFEKKYITKFYNSPAGIFERHFNIPLNFWFVRNPGLALPLVALQYHDVELEIQLKAAKDLYTLLIDDKKYYYYENESNLYGNIFNDISNDKEILRNKQINEINLSIELVTKELNDKENKLLNDLNKYPDLIKEIYKLLFTKQTEICFLDAQNENNPSYIKYDYIHSILDVLRNLLNILGDQTGILEYSKDILVGSNLYDPTDTGHLQLADFVLEYANNNSLISSDNLNDLNQTKADLLNDITEIRNPIINYINQPSINDYVIGYLNITLSDIAQIIDNNSEFSRINQLSPYISKLNNFKTTLDSGLTENNLIDYLNSIISVLELRKELILLVGTDYDSIVEPIKVVEDRILLWKSRIQEEESVICNLKSNRANYNTKKLMTSSSFLNDPSFPEELNDKLDILTEELDLNDNYVSNYWENKITQHNNTIDNFKNLIDDEKAVIEGIKNNLPIEIYDNQINQLKEYLEQLQNLDSTCKLLDNIIVNLSSNNNQNSKNLLELIYNNIITTEDGDDRHEYIQFTINKDYSKFLLSTIDDINFNTLIDILKFINAKTESIPTIGNDDSDIDINSVLNESINKLKIIFDDNSIIDFIQFSQLPELKNHKSDLQNKNFDDDTELYVNSSHYTDTGPEFILTLNKTDTYERNERIFQVTDEGIASGIVRYTSQNANKISVLIPGNLKFKNNLRIYKTVPIGNNDLQFNLTQDVINKFSVDDKENLFFLYSKIFMYLFFGNNYNDDSYINWNQALDLKPALVDITDYNQYVDIKQDFARINGYTGSGEFIITPEHIPPFLNTYLINTSRQNLLNLINYYFQSFSANKGFKLNFTESTIWFNYLGFSPSEIALFLNINEGNKGYLVKSAESLAEPVVINIEINYKNLSTLPGYAGSNERIIASRERAARRSNLIGESNKGLKTWTPKLRIKPLTTNKDHHISNFLYGSYSERTWNFEPSLDINYIFLDNEERRVFAEISHQYLIEQVIRVEKKGLQGDVNVELDAYHPVKEILFTASRDDNDTRNEWMNNTTRPIKPGGGSAYDWQDHWWQHSVDVSEGITDPLIPEKGPIIFSHPTDGMIECDRLQELLFRFGPNGEAGDTALDMSDTILGFVIQNRHSLYNLSVFKKIKEGSSQWSFTKGSEIPRIDNDDYEIYRSNPLFEARIKFNGQARQEMHRHEFYSQVQAYQHHSATPNQPIYVYSFALNPEKYQPSGACNMSRIKSIEFDLKLKETPISKVQKTSSSIYKPYGNGNNITRDWLYNLDFYVVGYNILKIMGGLGGLVFGN